MLVSAIHPHTFWRTEVAWRMLRIDSSDTVLDAGCGEGYFAERASQVAARVVAVDHSAAVIAHNRTRSSGGRAPEFRHGSLLELDTVVKGERFSKVVCLDVLEHVQKAPVVIENLMRTVLGGGVLCLTVPTAGDHGHFELQPKDMAGLMARGGLRLEFAGCVQPRLPAALAISMLQSLRSLVSPPTDVDDWSETSAFRLVGRRAPGWLKLYQATVWPVLRRLIAGGHRVQRDGGDLLLVVARR